jgi:hypothetical protein
MFKRFHTQAKDDLEELEVDGGFDTRRGRDYIASEFLVHAVNTALALSFLASQAAVKPSSALQSRGVLG